MKSHEGQNQYCVLFVNNIDVCRHLCNHVTCSIIDCRLSIHKKIPERIENISGEVNQLWDEISSLLPRAQTNGKEQDIENKITRS